MNTFSFFFFLLTISLSSAFNTFNNVEYLLQKQLQNLPPQKSNYEYVNTYSDNFQTPETKSSYDHFTTARYKEINDENSHTTPLIINQEHQDVKVTDKPIEPQIIGDNENIKAIDSSKLSSPSPSLRHILTSLNRIFKKIKEPCPPGHRRPLQYFIKKDIALFKSLLGPLLLHRPSDIQTLHNLLLHYQSFKTHCVSIMGPVRTTYITKINDCVKIPCDSGSPFPHTPSSSKDITDPPISPLASLSSESNSGSVSDNLPTPSIPSGSSSEHTPISSSSSEALPTPISSSSSEALPTPISSSSSEALPTPISSSSSESPEPSPSVSPFAPPPSSSEVVDEGNPEDIPWNGDAWWLESSSSTTDQMKTNSLANKKSSNFFATPMLFHDPPMGARFRQLSRVDFPKFNHKLQILLDRQDRDLLQIPVKNIDTWEDEHDIPLNVDNEFNKPLLS